MNPSSFDLIVQVALVLIAISLLVSAAVLIAALCYYYDAKRCLEELLQSPSAKRDSSGRLYKERL